MNYISLINIFYDTQDMILDSPDLQSSISNTLSSSQVYLENFTSSLHNIKSTGNIEVLETTTFQCARDLQPTTDKIAVLNFANPVEPGGGVLRGAMAQEECICRCSTLYNVISQPQFIEDYYDYHYDCCDNDASDRLIYTPSITVIKSDDHMPLDTYFNVDVITCAAPYLDSSTRRKTKELMTIYQSRIRNILEVAMSRDVDIIILGAFGCGAFNNDPKLMSQAFKELLVDEDYMKYFKKVIFAIKSTGKNCPNITAFKNTFK